MKQRKAPPTEEEEEEDVDAETFNGKTHVKNVSSSKNRSFGTRLKSISNYDLFWLAFGIFIMRWLYFLATNGMPHKPTPKPRRL